MRLLRSPFLLLGTLVVVLILAVTNLLRPRVLLLGFLVVLILYGLLKFIRDVRAWRGK